jgi:hypothetical protein
VVGQPAATLWTRHGLQRHARLPEPGEVTFHGAPADAQPLSQLGRGHQVDGCAEDLDQPLLPLHPPQRQVVVPRVGGPPHCHRWFHGPEITATGLAELITSVDGMDNTTQPSESIEDFFARYTGYLTDGDLDGLAGIYHYPSLAVSPSGILAITDPQQTRDFFAAGREFYHRRQIMAVRATDIVPDIEVRTIWVGHLVLENLDGNGDLVDRERNAYQVVTGSDGTRLIAVTTPLDG